MRLEVKLTITLVCPQCQFQPNQNKHNKNEWAHNLVCVTHKVSDHHLHHGWQWLAAITPHWTHKLSTVGVDKLMAFSGNNYMKSHVLSFYYISRSNRKAQSCCQVAFMRHYFPSSIYNAVTALWRHAHLTILIMHTAFWQQSTHAFFWRSNFHFPVLKFAVNEPHSYSLLYLKMSIGRKHANVLQATRL
jgi:hypothetical protein